MLGQRGQGFEQADPVLAPLAHAHDAATAHVHAGIAHLLQGVQAVLEGACGDDLAVELGRGVQVVVVIVQAGSLKARRLVATEHAQRHAGFKAQRLDLAHHVQHAHEILLARAAPGGAHAEAAGPGIARGARGGDHGIHVQQRLALQVGLVVRALRAVAAVLRTGAGLDAQQRAHLHGVGVEMGAVRGLRAVQQVAERQLEQGANLGARPVVTNGGQGRTPENGAGHEPPAAAAFRIAVNATVST